MRGNEDKKRAADFVFDLILRIQLTFDFIK